METYYLIDFENVNGEGLAGCNTLSKSDHILIFFTRNAMKINMSDIADHGEAILEMIEVPSGKQSTDIHISSYIGYLAGIYRETGCNIVVVSKDSDFDKVMGFWRSKNNMQISRSRQIRVNKDKAAAQKPAAEKNAPKKQAEDKPAQQKPAADKASGKAAADAVPPEQSVKKEVKPAAAPEVKPVPAAEAKADTAAEVKTDDKAAARDAGKEAVAAEPKSEGNKKTILNNTIVKVLNKAGFENDIAGSVASIAVKNYEVKNSRQQTYRAIISKYGQNKGLQIYNCIKKEL